jgi:hypothetical protein
LTTLAVYLIANVLMVVLLAFLYRNEIRRSVGQYEARVDSMTPAAARPVEREAATV